MHQPQQSGPPAFYDHRRTPEFQRFYYPAKAALLKQPPWLDLHDDSAVRQHRPALSPDTALTAFCQLAAVRLNVKRAMIFLFDANQGYVLAEATKTTSFRLAARQASDDGLWLGHTAIPRGFSVCEHTVNLPDNLGSNRVLPSAHVAHIINDLTGDERFCARPYVTDGPQLRYYAGVPITTPAGANIGAFCALDDKPRYDTATDDIDMLVDLSGAIMSHLDAIRAKTEHQLSVVRLGSLVTFLNDTRDFDQPHPFQSAHSLPPSATKLPPLDLDDGASLSPQHVGPCSTIDRPAGITEPTRSRDDISRSAKRDADQDSFTELPVPSLDQSLSNTEPRNTNSLEDIARRVFQHAAFMLRQALDVDSVVFLDAAFQNLGDGVPVEEAGHMKCHTSSDSHNSHDDFIAKFKTNNQSPPNVLEDEPCAILGVAHLQSPSTQTFKMPRRQLKRLSRKFEMGKIWKLSEGDSSSAAEEADEPISPVHSTSSNTQVHEHVPARPRQWAGTSSFLKSMAPAHSVIFLPIWNHGSSKLFAGTLIATSSPIRNFTVDGELQFVRLFCDIIVAVMGRLDSQFTSQAKSTFVSSISHELRTPLHGILGTVEHLRGATSSDETDMLVSQIEMCGQTMLDIINHILDFSHVNRLVAPPASSAEDSVGSSKTTRILRKGLSRTRRTRAMQPKSALDKVSEQIIDSTIHSYHLEQPLHLKVVTILDIDQSAFIDWTTVLATGAWKRVCTNIIVNALKFTSQGYIRIEMKQEISNDAKGDVTALLIVTDTGRGMSEDFVQNSLFSPFEQEDVLSSGSGLGLCLVAKILNAIRGRISIKSALGSGTTVTVAIPWPKPRKRKIPLNTSTSDIGRQKRPNVLVPDFLGESWTSEQSAFGLGRTVLHSHLSKLIAYISHEIDLASYAEHDIHIHVVTAHDLAWLNIQMESRSAALTQDGPGLLPSRYLIVVCKDILSARSHKKALAAYPWAQLLRIQCIVEPYGILQVSKAVLACLGLNDLEPQADRGSLDSLFEQSRRRLNRTQSFPPGDAKPRKRSEPATSSRSLDSALPTCHANNTPLSPGKRSTPVDSVPQHQPETSPSLSSPNIEASPLSAALSIRNGPKYIPTPEPSPFMESQTLPAQLPRRPVAPSFVTASHKPVTPLTGLTMLLVDDNDVNMRLLSMFADRKRHSRLVAVNGLEACQQYEAALMAKLIPHDSAPTSTSTVTTPDFGHPLQSQQTSYFAPRASVPSPPASAGSVLPWPQVILMDINMPIMDGNDATRRIRAFEKTMASPFRAYIIAMTGLGTEDAHREAMASGMDLYLTKPVRLKDLTRILTERFEFLQ